MTNIIFSLKDLFLRTKRKNKINDKKMSFYTINSESRNAVGGGGQIPSNKRAFGDYGT